MTDMSCGYSGDRDQTLVSYVYDDLDAAARAAFDAHLITCARCRTEVSAFEGVRAQLACWAPPEPASLVGSRGSAVEGRQSWWRDVPAWARVAAALLVVGVAAGVANLEVHYGADGLRVRTGWLLAPGAAALPVPPAAQRGEAPWRADLAALEQRLRRDVRDASPANPANPAGLASPESMRRVRALIDESERRQERELALKIAEVMRDVNVQRQADLVRIDRSIGAIQNNTGFEIMRQRSELLNLVRTSLQKPQ